MPPAATPATSVQNPLPNLEDFRLVERCLSGDSDALRALQDGYKPQIIGYLLKSGSDPAQAEEIVDQLWADLIVVATPGGIPKIARYDGSCRLTTWLNTVAMNRLLSARRSQKRAERHFGFSLDAVRPDDEGGQSGHAQVPAPDLDNADLPLIDLLRDAIQEAFAALPAENYVLLQLAFGDGLRLRELGQIWGCNPATISRRLEQTSQEIQRHVLTHIRSADPLLEITWDDFVQLCRNASLGALGFS